jgi:hypothetical protein
VDLHPGDEVDIELRDDEIVLVARRHPARLGGRFAGSGMAARLLEDRARAPLSVCLDSWAVLSWRDGERAIPRERNP